MIINKQALRKLGCKERARYYSETFPQRPPLAGTERWFYGVWIIGNMYGHKKELYGTYPIAYLKRIHAIFPDAENVLHLFSGTVEKGLWVKETKFDIDPTYKPDIIGNAKKLSEYFPQETFDLIIADPPYEKIDFEKYNQPSLQKRLVLKECLKICKKDGFLVWLDTRMPMYNKKEWLLKGTIGIIVGTNTRFRLCSFFEKVS